METLFREINFSIPKSVDSTIDIKILDTVCDHAVLNEEINFTQPTSGAGYATFTTSLPLDLSNYQLLERQNSDINNYIEEVFIVPSGLSTIESFSYPPIPNSVSARLQETIVDEDNETQIIYFSFTNYTLFQLTGKFKFTNKNDINSTIVFKYIADIRNIIQKNKDATLNWELIGINQDGNGIFKIYGRAFNSDDSQLFIRYKTKIQNCTKCGGTGKLTDIDINPLTNQVVSVYDFSKLIQDYFKRFFTRLGSNPFNPSDGSQLELMVGAAQKNAPLLETFIRTEAVNVLNKVRAKHAKQRLTQGISLAEQMQQINRLAVYRTNDNRFKSTDINLDIEVLSKSNKTTQIQKKL